MAQVAGAQVDINRMTGITDSVLDLVGNTPLIRLKKVPKSLGIECEVVAKLEFFNPGGSIKDRIARQMVLDAQASGRLHKGDMLVEPTSGNTGIGLSLAAVGAGYKMTVVMPEKMSKEKEVVIKSLGADVIRTPDSAAWDDAHSHIGVSLKMQRDDPGHTHVLDQYANPANIRAHYDGTAEEIIRQCGGKLDMVVMGAGTGGTMTGICKKIKERLPHVQIVAVDPVGSLLAEGKYGPGDGPKSYHVEGIGYDFVPDVCHRGIVDKWVKTEDAESFEYARRLIKEEGILIGGSAGSAMAGVVKAAKGLRKDQRCVVIFSDGIRNYLTKFADDDWMREQGFLKGPQKRLTYDQQKARIKDLESENKKLRARL
jgi:cystathionine beta-synthase